MKTSDYMINFVAEKRINRIFYVAGGGRKSMARSHHRAKGFCLLDVPLDSQGSQSEPDLLEGFDPEEKDKTDFSEGIDVLLQMIQENKRPVVLAGNGLRHFPPLHFLEKSTIPVIPSW